METEAALAFPPESPPPAGQPPVPWGWPEVLFALGVAIAGFFVLILISFVIEAALNPTIFGVAAHGQSLSSLHLVGLAPLTFFATVALEAGLAGTAVLAAWIFHRRQFRWNILGYRGFDWRLGLGLVGVGLLGNIVLTVVLQEAIDAFHIKVTSNVTTIEQQFAQQTGWLVATLMLAVFLAPVCEELFFRGFLFQGLRRQFGPLWAGLISTLIFTAFHMVSFTALTLDQFLGLIPIFLLGGTICFVFEKTRSIFPGMLLHFSWNGLTTVLVLFSLFAH